MIVYCHEHISNCYTSTLTNKTSVVRSYLFHNIYIINACTRVVREVRGIMFFYCLWRFHSLLVLLHCIYLILCQVAHFTWVPLQQSMQKSTTKYCASCLSWIDDSKWPHIHFFASWNLTGGLTFNRLQLIRFRFWIAHAINERTQYHRMVQFQMPQPFLSSLALLPESDVQVYHPAKFRNPGRRHSLSKPNRNNFAEHNFKETCLVSADYDVGLTPCKLLSMLHTTFVKRQQFLQGYDTNI